MAKDKYFLTYGVHSHPKGLTRKQIEKKGEDTGACDAVLLASIIYPPDGSLSILFIGWDGRPGKGKELADIEWFKVWSMLAGRLGKSKTLSPGRRNLAANTFEIIREAILKGHDEEKDAPARN